jgi:hypothetical protein
MTVGVEALVRADVQLAIADVRRRLADFDERGQTTPRG